MLPIISTHWFWFILNKSFNSVRRRNIWAEVGNFNALAMIQKTHFNIKVEIRTPDDYGYHSEGSKAYIPLRRKTISCVR